MMCNRRHVLSTLLTIYQILTMLVAPPSHSRGGRGTRGVTLLVLADCLVETFTQNIDFR